MEYKKYIEDIDEIWNTKIPRTKITYQNGKIEYRNSMEYRATATKPEFYPLETLQSVFGEEEGLKMYNERCSKYNILKVEYEKNNPEYQKWQNQKKKME